MFPRVRFLCAFALVLGAVWFLALDLWPDPTPSQNQFISAVQSAVAAVASALFVMIIGKE